MDLPLGFLVCLILFSLSAKVLFFLRKSSVPGKLPPGPPGWPIFGNMFELGTMPHRTLTSLKDKHGPIICFKLGAVNTMAILSAKVATEFFKNHDLSFAERNIIETMRAHDYHKSSVALAPYGSYWRVLRRLVTVDMLVNKKINQTASLRKKRVNDMLQRIEDEARKNQAEDGNGIHVARFVFLLTFNLLGNLTLSHDLIDPDSKEGSEFFVTMSRMMENSGQGNIADFFSWLRCWTLKDLKGRRISILVRLCEGKDEGEERGGR